MICSMILSCGVVVVRKEPRGWKFLLLRAYRNWDFPKGEIEPGEDPLPAAVREVAEETGISDLSFSWGGDFKETEPYREGRKIARYYLAETHAEHLTLPVNPSLGHPEHHEYRWLSYSEVQKLVPPRLQPVIDWAYGLIRKGD